MAIFPHLDLESVVQVNDRTRLSATKIFITQDEAAITLVEIEPEAAAGFIDVSGSSPLKSKNWFLDYEYATDGDKTVTVRVTTDGSPVTESKTISIISEANDKLFSADSDLRKHEPNILDSRNLPDGRNSFLDVHRRSQEMIIAKFDEMGIVDTSGAKLTKDAVVDASEVKQWSVFLTLRLIFEGLSNAVDDIFAEKSRRYRALEAEARDRAILRLDLDGDGSISVGEGVNIKTVDLIRR